MSLAIRAAALHKSYGGKPAVQGLDLEVRRGEFFGFLGPNGAGKTTTIHALTGVIEATSGEIEVLGMKVPEEIIAVKRQIGVVPDENVLFDRLTGYEFLEFAGRMYGLDRDTAAQRSKELMELFELDLRADTLIAGYSKGMKKRVALGAALIHRPSLFLLDEPFEGVDPVGARLMKEILQQQVAQGATVFLTSHVLEVVERLCTRVAIINNGRVVAEGSVGELRTAEETLEDIFMRVVGGEKEMAALAWL
jgi:ABC-2 type transport system ATP-binding protein